MRTRQPFPAAQGNLTGSESTLVIRPSRAYATQRPRGARAWLLALMLAFAASGLAFGLRSTLWWFLAGIAGGAAALLGYVNLYFRNVAIFTDGNVFGTITSLGRVRQFPKSTLARIVLTRVHYTFAPPPGRPEIYFLDSRGKLLASVKGSGWLPDDLALLWRRLDHEPEGSFDRPVSLHRVNQAIPVPWVRRYALLLTCLALFGFVIAITIVLDHLGIHLRR